jgi:hypothetical protein
VESRVREVLLAAMFRPPGLARLIPTTTAADHRSRLEGGDVMTAPRPCYRHPRRVWMLACPECTAWHLPAARARHNQVASTAATAGVADRFTPRPEPTDAAPRHLHLAA